MQAEFSESQIPGLIYLKITDGDNAEPMITTTMSHMEALEFIADLERSLAAIITPISKR